MKTKSIEKRTTLGRHQILDLIGLVHRRKYEMYCDLKDDLDWIWTIEYYDEIEKSLKTMLIEAIGDERREER